MFEFVTIEGAELELIAEGGQYVIRRTPFDGGPVEETARGVCADVRQVWCEMTGTARPRGRHR